MRRIRVLQSFSEPRATSNPYIHQLAASLRATPGIELRTFSWSEALRGDYDVFHAHWPDTLLAGNSRLTRAGKRLAVRLLLARLRRRGIPVVRTRHNAKPHETSRTVSAVEAGFERLTVESILLNGVGTPPPHATVIPHGHYRDWFARHPRAERVPGRLAFVGLIRPYKGVEDLVAAYRELSADGSGASLTIAGSPRSAELAAEITAAAQGDPTIALTFAYVDDVAFVQAVTASSLVVLPYRAMENSGAALAALSLDRPVLLPRNAMTESLRTEAGDEWVLLFDGTLTAAALREALAASAEATGSPRFIGREWGDAGEQHRRVFAAALGGSAVGDSAVGDSAVGDSALGDSALGESMPGESAPAERAPVIGEKEETA
ncbi:MAG: glycosyl transferase [Microbacterium sp.]|nr:MAG: glycosyl transferase [Microbacterium sp.]